MYRVPRFIRSPLLSPVRALLLAFLALAGGQSAFAAAPPAIGNAPAQARQFDFLVGQWQLAVQPKVNSLVAMIHGVPKLMGTWKAWSAFDGRGVEDELRVFDSSGNPMLMNQSLRIYAAAEGHWKISALDVYRTHFGESTAQLQAGVMQVDGSGTDDEGKPYLSRTRYITAGPDHFKMQQDRSFDNGKNWDEAVLTIDATRVKASTP